ncbi:MAG: DUF1499 domain-containing protein [Parvularculaceae bacterium]
MRLIVIILSVAALVLAAALAALGPGTRFGLWDYATALGWMRNFLALPVLVAAAGAALAFLLALWKARSLAPLALVALIAAGAAGYAPIKMREMALSNPFIHDITTDFEHPPEIVAGANAERKNPPEYVGDELVRNSDKTVAEAQMEAFPDIQPLLLEAPVEKTTLAARGVLAQMKLKTIAEGPVSDESGSGWRIEATATSLWFGFTDDFIVRLTPTENDGTRVDIRSKSRVGLSDLGANATRVREFLKKLDAAV